MSERNFSKWHLKKYGTESNLYRTRYHTYMQI